MGAADGLSAALDPSVRAVLLNCDTAVGGIRRRPDKYHPKHAQELVAQVLQCAPTRLVEAVDIRELFDVYFEFADTDRTGYKD